MKLVRIDCHGSRRWLSLFVILILPLWTGCSSFHRDWRASLKQPIPANDLAGPWDGYWVSDVNGHNGRLRCIMVKKTEQEYDAHFHAKYKRVLSFGYTVPMTVKKEGTNFVFSGEADLGKLAGGVYSYQGKASAEEFFSTYHSKYDHGRFEMKRPD